MSGISRLNLYLKEHEFWNLMWTGILYYCVFIVLYSTYCISLGNIYPHILKMEIVRAPS